MLWSRKAECIGVSLWSAFMHPQCTGVNIWPEGLWGETHVPLGRTCVPSLPVGLFKTTLGNSSCGPAQRHLSINRCSVHRKVIALLFWVPPEVIVSLGRGACKFGLKRGLPMLVFWVKHRGFQLQAGCGLGWIQSLGLVMMSPKHIWCCSTVSLRLRLQCCWVWRVQIQTRSWNKTSGSALLRGCFILPLVANVPCGLCAGRASQCCCQWPQKGMVWGHSPAQCKFEVWYIGHEAEHPEPLPLWAAPKFWHW